MNKIDFEYKYKYINHYYLISKERYLIHYNLYYFDDDYFFVIDNKQRMYNDFPIYLKIEDVIENKIFDFLIEDDYIEMIKRKLKIKRLLEKKH